MIVGSRHMVDAVWMQLSISKGFLPGKPPAAPTVPTPLNISIGILKKEDWQTDGSLKAILEIPAAARPNMIDRLGAVTKGTAFVEVLK